jgi:2-methylcitrate dehydratase PrpD
MQGFIAALANTPTEVSHVGNDMVRGAFLDTFGCIHAGMSEPVVTKLKASQQASSASGLAACAMIWGTAAHSQDYDDYEAFSFAHPSAVLVAVILSLHEKTPITFDQATKAYVAGYETIATLGRALGHVHYLQGWHATATLGGIGGARTAAVLLNLPAEQQNAAMTIAMTRAAGLKAHFGSEVKPLHAGLAAANAIESAFQAAAGITTGAEVFAGETAFHALYGDAATPANISPPFVRLEGSPIFQKIWPSCAYTHRSIEAALRLCNGSSFRGENIAELRLETPVPYGDVASQRAPKSTEAARFSATFCTAAALIDGHFNGTSVEQTSFLRPDVIALESRVDFIRYPLPIGAGDLSPLAPDRVILKLSNGQILKQEVRHPKGGPQKPMSPADLITKFVDCGGRASAAEAFLGAPGNATFTLPCPL